jgi:hypothetical protein
MANQPEHCEHVYAIASELAKHDHPGLPSILELTAGVQESYLDLAEQVVRGT